MIQDLHSHTYYSFCGKDSPETIVEAAINGGIELFGICDHCHGVGFGSWAAYAAPEDIVPNKYNKFALQKYFEHLSLVKEKYADKLTVMRGIEITAHLNTPKIAPAAPVSRLWPTFKRYHASGRPTPSLHRASRT